MSQSTNSRRYIPTIEDIYQIYKKYTNADIFITSRKRQVVEYRAMFANLCIQYSSSTVTQIGKFLSKDHASVLHYKKLFETVSRFNPEAYEVYTKTEADIVYRYPYLYPKYEKRPKKIDPRDAQMTYVRRLNAYTVKLNFYREYTYKLEAHIKSLKSQLNEKRELHKLEQKDT